MGVGVDPHTYKTKLAVRDPVQRNWKQDRKWLLLLPLPFVGLFALTLAVALYRLPFAQPPFSPHQTLRGVFHLQGNLQNVHQTAQKEKLDFLVHASPHNPGPPPTAGPITIPASLHQTEDGDLILMGEDAHYGASETEIMKRASMGTLVRPASWSRGWNKRALSSLLRTKTKRHPLLHSFPSLGMEILNGGTEPENESVPPYLPLLWGAWAKLFNPSYALLSFYDRPVEALELWDKANLNRDEVIPGFCAADLREEIDDLSLRQKLFGTYVVIPGALPNDRESTASYIQEALQKGRTYCAVDLLAHAHGFSFEIAAPGRPSLLPGDNASYQNNLQLKIQAPTIPGLKTRLSILHNGQVETLRAGSELSQTLKAPGVYRVEVDILVPKPGFGEEWTTWIYSNPILLHDDS